ncbi:MAG: putative DNA binding domain-containing protein [Saprospiraceae bacterium]|nr:putative DNA binding domain-containing protein [Saprospiraceae bacterium]
MQNLDLTNLLDRLLKTGRESEWLEFKENNKAPEMVGERISALSNSAALHHEQFGYLVFGVQDNTLNVVGTNFKPNVEKIGNEPLENWLHQRLSPKIDFRFLEFQYNQKPVVLVQIPSAKSQPVKFNKEAFIRIGSITRRLNEFSDKERKIWQNEAHSFFESEVAIANVGASDVIELLDTQSFFELIKIPYPESREGVIERLLSEKMIVRTNGRFNITNFGALLLAKNLNNFDALARKALRFIRYEGKDKLKTLKDAPGKKGYAVGFESLMTYIGVQLPTEETIGKTGIRREKSTYPIEALRELIANAIIHQDFRVTGMHPTIELYADRMEISNPGIPIISPNRFIDSYQSRNEKLAAFMRRIGICEEKGSGIDKVFFQVEQFNLPPPAFQELENQTKVTLYSYRPLALLSKDEKIRACYQHCCLKYVSSETMTNQSLRERFKVEEKDISVVSRIIKDALDAGMIKLSDPESASRKFSKYIPIWA